MTTSEDRKGSEESVNDTKESIVSAAKVTCNSCKKTAIIEIDPAIPYVNFHKDYMLNPKCPNCDSSNCLIMAWQQKQEMITVTDADISFVLETIYKEAECDRPSVKQLFYGMCSAMTKNGMSHDVNSAAAGAGKNYLLRLVSSLFPRKYVGQFAGVSDKAFFHKRGKMVIKNEQTGELTFVEPVISKLEREMGECETAIEIEKDSPLNARNRTLMKEKRVRLKEIEGEIRTIKKAWQKLIVIDGLIIILLDTPQEGFIANLMSLVSGDTGEDQEYLFTDKTPSGKNEAASNIIRGRPTIFIAHVSDDTSSKRFGEKNRRFIPVTPDTSKEKINAALRLMSKKAGLVPEQYDLQVVSEADKDRAKRIVAAVVEKLRDHSKNFAIGQTGVSVPFQAALAESILADEDGDVWRMTVNKRIEDYLAIITNVHMDNRPRLVHIETGLIYPIATFADLSETLEIMERGGTNIKAYLVDFYNKVFLPRFKEEDGQKKGDYVMKENYVGITTEEIGEMMQRLGIPNPGSKLLRDRYLYPLFNSGLLDYEKSALNRGQNLWFPVGPEAIVNAFTLFEAKDNGHRLTANPEFYPSPQLIEETYSSIVKDARDSKNVQQKKFYRLEESDGSEISIQVMIEKYFSNPESCFKMSETRETIEHE